MKDLYFIKINGKSQLIAAGPRADFIHVQHFKTRLLEMFDYILNAEKLDDEEMDRYPKQIIWSMLKAANKKTPGFEKWRKEVGPIETAPIISEIAKKVIKRTVK